MDSRGDSWLLDGAGEEQGAGTAARVEVVLFNPYELGRRP